MLPPSFSSEIAAWDSRDLFSELLPASTWGTARSPIPGQSVTSSRFVVAVFGVSGGELDVSFSHHSSLDSLDAAEVAENGGIGGASVLFDVFWLVTVLDLIRGESRYVHHPCD